MTVTSSDDADRIAARVTAHDRDERVVADARGPRGSVVLATDRGLWLPPAASGEPPTCLPWHLVSRATWSGGALEVVAAREVEEETGIRPLDLRPFGFADDPAHEVWTYPNGDVCHYFTLLFHATVFEGRAAPDGDESLEVGWFQPDAPPPLMPVMARTLAAFQAYRRTGAFQTI